MVTTGRQATIERLVATEQASRTREEGIGRRLGRQWAKHFASFPDLRSVAELEDYGSDAMLPESLMTLIAEDIAVDWRGRQGPSDVVANAALAAAADFYSEIADDVYAEMALR